jgi:hypothetical protein
MELDRIALDWEFTEEDSELDLLGKVEESGEATPLEMLADTWLCSDCVEYTEWRGLGELEWPGSGVWLIDGEDSWEDLATLDCSRETDGTEDAWLCSEFSMLDCLGDVDDADFRKSRELDRWGSGVIWAREDTNCEDFCVLDACNDVKADDRCIVSDSEPKILDFSGEWELGMLDWLCRELVRERIEILLEYAEATGETEEATDTGREDAEIIVKAELLEVNTLCIEPTLLDCGAESKILEALWEEPKALDLWEARLAWGTEDWASEEWMEDWVMEVWVTVDRAADCLREDWAKDLVAEDWAEDCATDDWATEDRMEDRVTDDLATEWRMEIVEDGALFKELDLLDSAEESEALVLRKELGVLDWRREILASETEDRAEGRGTEDWTTGELFTEERLMVANEGMLCKELSLLDWAEVTETVAFCEELRVLDWRRERLFRDAEGGVAKGRLVLDKEKTLCDELTLLGCAELREEVLRELGELGWPTEDRRRTNEEKVFCDELCWLDFVDESGLWEVLCSELTELECATEDRLEMMEEAAFWNELITLECEVGESELLEALRKELRALDCLGATVLRATEDDRARDDRSTDNWDTEEDWVSKDRITDDWGSKDDRACEGRAPDDRMIGEWGSEEYGAGVEWAPGDWIIDDWGSEEDGAGVEWAPGDWIMDDWGSEEDRAGEEWILDDWITDEWGREEDRAGEEWAPDDRITDERGSKEDKAGEEWAPDGWATEVDCASECWATDDRSTDDWAIEEDWPSEDRATEDEVVGEDWTTEDLAGEDRGREDVGEEEWATEDRGAEDWPAEDLPAEERLEVAEEWILCRDLRRLDWLGEIGPVAEAIFRELKTLDWLWARLVWALEDCATEEWVAEDWATDEWAADDRTTEEWLGVPKEAKLCMELWKLDCLGAIEPAEEAILREVKALGWLGVWLVGAV